MAREAVSGSISFEDFFAAIAGQESGGNYGAINSRTGASGKYQIMPANIGPWSQKYLGQRISVQQFRSSPQLQERLARAVLSDYFNRYGARGAAAAWYSGSPSKAGNYTRFRSNEPSVGEYVDQVLQRVGHVAPSSSSAPASAPQVKPSLSAPVTPLAASNGADALSVQPNSLGQTESQQASAVPSLGGLGGQVGGTGSDPRRDRIIAEAMRYIGTPYVWGGTSPKGFDCSGLLYYVYGKNGVTLPRISADQARFGRRVDLSQLRPGDFVATDNSSRNAGADHIAIWLGNGQILEAPHAGANVRLRTLGRGENYYGVALDI